MDLLKNPIARLKSLQEAAVGFLLTFWKRIGQSRPFPPKPSALRVAVDLGQSHLLVLAVGTKSGKPEIAKFRLEPRPPTPEAVSERLREIFKEENLEPEGIRIALKGQGVVIRILTFPQMKREDFSSMIRYEADKYIPFKLSEVVLDFQILNQNIPHGSSEVMETLIVAVRQSEIYRVLKMFQDADLKVGVIDVYPFAAANLLEFLTPDIRVMTVGFLDLGVETTSFGILKSGKPAFFRDICFGGQDFLNLVKRKLSLEVSAVTEMQMHPGKQTPEYRQLIQEGMTNLIKELKLSIGYYTDHVEGAAPIERLYIGGGGARFFSAQEILEKEIRIPVQTLKVLPQMEVAAGIDESKLRASEDLLFVAGGLCVRT